MRVRWTNPYAVIYVGGLHPGITTASPPSSSKPPSNTKCPSVCPKYRDDLNREPPCMTQATPSARTLLHPGHRRVHANCRVAAEPQVSVRSSARALGGNRVAVTPWSPLPLAHFQPDRAS